MVDYVTKLCGKSQHACFTNHVEWFYSFYLRTDRISPRGKTDRSAVTCFCKASIAIRYVDSTIR